MRERAEARVGQVLRGKWKLDELLGVGGMASVYAATHRNGKRGAVKMLHPELSTSESARGRFLREGYVANTVSHPGAVSVLDDDTTEEGAVFLVMELLEGATIDALAASRPGERLELGEVLAIADQLLDVLAAAHDKGIIHRDLKPENLFLTKDGAVHVLDFGIARLRQENGAATSTRTGETMGTPAFMPPEQALGEWESVDARSDLWSVGATMFTLLTGQFVHDAETVQKLMLAAMTRPAPALASVLPGVPASVARIVDRALAQARDARWPDAKTMQTAIRAIRSEFPARLSTAGAGGGALGAAPTAIADDSRARAAVVLTAAPVATDTASGAARRRGLVAAGAVAIGAVAAFGIWWFAGRTTAPTPHSASESAQTSAPVEAPTAPGSAATASTPLVQPVESATPVTASATASAAQSANAPPITTARPPPAPTTGSLTPPPAVTAPPSHAPPPPPPPPADTTFHGRF